MSERKTILIVDDSATGRKELCDMLSSEYDLLEASDGSKALAVLKEYKDVISLVILDLYMPKMDGYEVLTCIRSDDEIANIPVIVGTSDDQIDGEIRARELGADDFVKKPYDRRTIPLRIDGILRRYSGSAVHSSTAAKAWAHTTIEDMLSGSGIFELSHGKLIPIFLSDLFYAVFGGKLEGPRDYSDDFFNIVDIEDVATLRSRFETAVTAEVNIFCEFKARRSDGAELWIRMQATRIPYPDRKGIVFQCHFWDITAIRTDVSYKKSYAVYDSLTEIYGRFSFIDVVRTRLQNANDKSHILIRINIDRFKAINEVFGSEAGDEVLRGVAEILRGLLFSVGDFGRLEADNFVACFSMKVLDPMRFIDMFNEKVKARFPDYNVLLSYGLYMINDVNTPVEVMFDRAQMALRSIKNSYITCFAIYNDSMLREVVEEQEIVGEMENAIETEQFTFFLQPVVDARTRTVVSAEALARWIHPEKGMIVPGRFIPIFEDNGFI
ncbi:MAG: response regulator, partial [Oscillospiraceae bacterium]|nr:response regulator [Oscillospiraceae bacterium]